MVALRTRTLRLAAWIGEWRRMTPAERLAWRLEGKAIPPGCSIGEPVVAPMIPEE
jgi:hypothetical protein